MSQARRQRPDELLEPLAIARVEIRRQARVEVEHRRDLAAFVEDRHDDLRACAFVAGDVAGEGVHISDQLGGALARRGAADPARERDLETAQRPLVGTDAQQVRADATVETGKAHPRNALEDQTGDGRHRGDVIVDAGERRLEVGEQAVVELGSRDGFIHGGIVPTERVRGLAHAPREVVPARSGEPPPATLGSGVGILHEDPFLLRDRADRKCMESPWRRNCFR